MSPRRERPSIPAAYGTAQDAAGMLDWDLVRRVIAEAPTYWMATVRSDGRPHLTPIWGLFVADRVYLGGFDTAVWARSLAAGSGLDVGVDHEGIQATIRGDVAKVTPDAELAAALDAASKAKHGYGNPPGDVWELTPTTVVAFEVASFATSATRFVFAG